jgi:hypothetical protein
MCDSSKEPHGFTDHKSEEKMKKCWNLTEKKNYFERFWLFFIE